MLPIFKKLTKLVSLDLTDTEITPASLKTMPQTISSLQTLTLKLNHGLTNDIGLSWVMKSNTNLDTLDVSNLFKMKDSTFAFLSAEGCQRFPSMQTLTLDLASELTERSLRWISKQCRELRTLTITAFPGVVTATLLELANNNQKLTKLCLSATEGVSEEGMQAIFSKCTNLTCAYILGGTYSSRPSNLSSFSALGVAKCQHVTDRSFRVMNQHITSLVDLDISELNNCTPMMVQAILQKNPHMRKIFVGGNRIPGTFMYQECRHNCSGLQIFMDSRMRVSPCFWSRPEEVNNVDPFWQRILTPAPSQ
jgi:hypothetical protein